MKRENVKIALLFCGTCLFVSCHNDIAQENQCRQEMWQISGSLFSMWQSGAELDGEDTSGTIIKFNEIDGAGVFNPRYNRVSNGRILDPNGHAYRIEFSHETGDVKIWSVGLNGIDEGGGGDDVSIAEKVTPGKRGP